MQEVFLWRIHACVIPEVGRSFAEGLTNGSSWHAFLTAGVLQTYVKESCSTASPCYPAGISWWRLQVVVHLKPPPRSRFQELFCSSSLNTLLQLTCIPYFCVISFEINIFNSFIINIRTAIVNMILWCSYDYTRNGGTSICIWNFE